MPRIMDDLYPDAEGNLCGSPEDAEQELKLWIGVAKSQGHHVTVVQIEDLPCPRYVVTNKNGQDVHWWRIDP